MGKRDITEWIALAVLATGVEIEFGPALAAIVVGGLVIVVAVLGRLKDR